MFKKAIYLIGILLLTNCIVAENYDANSALNYSFTWCNKNSVVYNLPANYGYNVAKYNNNLSANLIPPVVNYHFVPVNADGTVWHHELTGWYEDFDTAYT